MNTVITIQPGQPGMGLDYDVHQPLPYPFHIDPATGDCTRGRGTPEFEPDMNAGDSPWRLIGFQESDIQEVVLTLDEFVADPQAAVGLVPVFVDANDGFFNLTVPITAVHDRTGGER